MLPKPMPVDWESEQVGGGGLCSQNKSQGVILFLRWGLSCC